MKKVVMTVVGVLALAGSANAQLLGTWYTDQTEWLKYATVVDTAPYNTRASLQNGITSSASGGFDSAYAGLLVTNASTPITFTFSGNAFAGYFGMVNDSSAYVQRNITFSIDESSTEVRTLTSTPAGANTFLGYISNSASDISVKVTGNNSDYVAVDSFSRANGTNPLGASVAPEPGTLVLALTGGCALLGMFIHRRKAA
jgi:hypothetical protein